MTRGLTQHVSFATHLRQHTHTSCLDLAISSFSRNNITIKSLPLWVPLIMLLNKATYDPSSSPPTETIITIMMSARKFSPKTTLNLTFRKPTHSSSTRTNNYRNWRQQLLTCTIPTHRPWLRSWPTKMLIRPELWSIKQKPACHPLSHTACISSTLPGCCVYWADLPNEKVANADRKQ